MSELEKFLVPARAIWQAGIFYLIGLGLLLVSIIWPAPYAGIAKPDRWLLYDVVDKLAGLSGYAAQFILIGASVYAFLVALGDYLWNTKLEASIANGFDAVSKAVAVGSAKLSHKYVLRWIENSGESPECYKSIGSSCLRKYYGPHSSDENSYLEYVIDNLLETHARYDACTRHNYNINIVIRKNEKYNDLLQWEERKDYILRCHAGNTSIPIAAYMSSRATFNNVERLMSALNLTITVDGTIIFSFQKWKREIGDIDMSRPFEKTGGAGTLKFDGGWIYFQYKNDIDLSKRDTPITVVETSFITTDERGYSFISSEPSYNVSLTMRLEGLPGWQLQKPNIGNTWYHAGASEFAKVDRMHAQWVSASVPKWVLPGVWATVEWAAAEPPAADNLGLQPGTVSPM